MKKEKEYKTNEDLIFKFVLLGIFFFLLVIAYGLGYGTGFNESEDKYMRVSNCTQIVDFLPQKQIDKKKYFVYLCYNQTTCLAGRCL